MAKYSSKVLYYFFNPRNPGELDSPDGEGVSGGPEERNFMRITIKVEGDRIVDARFLSYTCPVAVAACSLVTEMVKQKTIAEALSLSPEAVASELGEIPGERRDRCVLVVEALHNAIADFFKKKSPQPSNQDH